MFRSFITIAAVAGLAAGASAQQQMPAVSLQPVSNLQYGSYDFNNGFTVTNGGNRAIGPDTLYDTTGNIAYYYGVIGGNTEKQEWCDEDQLPNRGLSTEEQITGMAWNYCEGGYTAYFDAYLSIYNDTVACVGPSAWVPASPSFADCVYGIGGLPGSGCWNVTVDLSCGFECVVPDAANPLSGSQGTIGWSVTPFNVNGTPFLGPFLGRQADAMPGSQDLFEWRDWNGLYFGSYTYGGCYWFGGIGPARADFHVAFYGAAIDIQNCYGSNALDTLCLEAADAAESASVWHFNVTGVASTARAFLMVQPDFPNTDAGCDQATMAGSGGSFTRQVAIPTTIPLSLGTVSADYSGALSIPGGSAADKHILFQAIHFNTSGPISPSNVKAASNGIDTTL